MTSPFLFHAGAQLTIDLAAICDNWRMLRDALGGKACAAVVKADAYGLGAAHVAPALAAAGSRHFFVAHLDEGIELRPLLPADADLYVLHGVPAGGEPDLLAHRLIPVLNSLAQIDAWTARAQAVGSRLPAIVQVDTGMARLGLSPAEVATLAADPARLAGIELRYLMSHLACAEEPDNPNNRLQLARFNGIRAVLPAAAASFANSSGIFLGPDYHFDLGRPGAALYGVAPVTGAANPMRGVVRLQGRVIQTRRLEPGTAVGYGQSWRAAAPTRIATVGAGYADGYLRSLSNRAVAYVGDVAVPLVGKVSMDTTTFDVSALPEDRVHEGSLIDLIGPHNPVDAVAERAGTIGYEILTSLGRRYARCYLG